MLAVSVQIGGSLFGSPYNKSPTIWGYILGPLIFGVSHMAVSIQIGGSYWVSI